MLVSRRAPRTHEANPRNRTIFQLRAAQLLSVPGRYRVMRDSLRLPRVWEPAARPYTGSLDNLSLEDVVTHFAATGVDDHDADDAWLFARQWLVDRRTVANQSLFEPRELEDSITRMERAVAENSAPVGRYNVNVDIRVKGIERPAEKVDGEWRAAQLPPKVIKRIFEDDDRQRKGIDNARAQEKAAFPKPPKKSQGSQRTQQPVASTSAVQLPMAEAQLSMAAPNWAQYPQQQQQMQQYPMQSGYLMPPMQQYGMGQPPNYMAQLGPYNMPTAPPVSQGWGHNSFGSEQPITRIDSTLQGQRTTMASQPPPASGGSDLLNYGSPASDLSGLSLGSTFRPMPEAYIAEVPEGGIVPTTGGTPDSLFGPFPQPSSSSSVASPLLSQHEASVGSTPASSGRHSRSASLPQPSTHADMDQTMG
jgi:hypothetical protein